MRIELVSALDGSWNGVLYDYIYMHERANSWWCIYKRWGLVIFVLPDQWSWLVGITWKLSFLGIGDSISRDTQFREVNRRFVVHFLEGNENCSFLLIFSCLISMPWLPHLAEWLMIWLVIIGWKVPLKIRESRVVAPCLFGLFHLYVSSTMIGEMQVCYLVNSGWIYMGFALVEELSWKSGVLWL